MVLRTHCPSAAAVRPRARPAPAGRAIAALRKPATEEAAWQLLDNLFRCARHPTTVKDAAFRYIYANEQAQRLLGRGLTELLGTTDYGALPRGQADRIRAADIQVLHSGEEQLFEQICAGPGGKPITIVTHKRRAAMPHDDAEPIVITEMTDVTDLRTAERVLREREEHLRSLIQLHPQTPWVADASGQVVEVGPGWAQLSGRPLPEANGTGWEESVHPDDLWWVRENWAESVETGTPLDIEFRIRARTGDYRWHRSRAQPKISEGGAIERWYGLLEDIHDRRLALEAFVEHEQSLRLHRNELEKLVTERTAELNQKNIELNRLLEHEREVNALQRRFVVMTSHEFRTPLTVIDAAAQRLTRTTSATPDYLTDKAAKIREAVARMVGVMESILAAGRLETGTLSITTAPCPIRDLIEDCAARAREISPAHHIHVDVARLPDMMRLDREAMEGVFTNLLSNAVKYMPQGGEIGILADLSEARAAIRIIDQGIGIDAEDVPRIFDPYFRARSARGIAGTGIGLNIAREIVKLHGGSIEVSSAIGKGTTMYVILPVDDNSVAVN